jgi:hypothetical protein
VHRHKESIFLSRGIMLPGPQPASLALIRLLRTHNANSSDCCVSDMFKFRLGAYFPLRLGFLGRVIRHLISLYFQLGYQHIVAKRSPPRCYPPSRLTPIVRHIPC